MPAWITALASALDLASPYALLLLPLPWLAARLMPPERAGSSGALRVPASVVADAARVLRHAWSVRFVVLAAIFSGLEIAFAVLAEHPPIPRGLFAGLSGATTILAFAFRFISQKEFKTDGDQ